MSDWKTVDEKPPRGRGVLVWCPGNKCHYMAYWTGSRWQPWNIGAEERKGITHWRETPPSPDDARAEHSLPGEEREGMGDDR